MMNVENIEKGHVIDTTPSKEKCPLFNSTVYLASSLMGSGKTFSVVSGIAPTDNVIIAVPKIDLSNSILRDFKKYRNDLDVEVINSETIPSNTTVVTEITSKINRVNEQVEDYHFLGVDDASGKVLIITQQSLTRLPSEALLNWVLIIDEVPDIKDNQYKVINDDLYERLFDEFVNKDSKGCLTLKEGLEQEAIKQLKQAQVSGVYPSELVFGGLLSATSEVSIEIRDDGKQIVKSVGYFDYSYLFDSAREVHILGNAIENSLFYLFLKSRGFKFKVSKFTPDFNGYNMEPTLVPMVSGDRFSKELMLTRKDGSKHNQFDESTIGWEMLKKAVEYHEGKPLLVHVFKWMHKFFKGNPYPNVTLVDFDSRGLNEYRDSHHRTVHILHGNDAPVDSRMNRRMLEMMGVSITEGLNALRHERLIEPIAQTMLRTDMRNIENQKNPTISVVPTIKMAEAIQENLNIKCNIDTSIMITPPDSEAKVSRGEKVQRAIELLASGMKKKDVATELDISRPTLNTYIKAA